MAKKETQEEESLSVFDQLEEDGHYVRIGRAQEEKKWAVEIDTGDVTVNLTDASFTRLTDIIEAVYPYL